MNRLSRMLLIYFALAALLFGSNASHAQQDDNATPAQQDSGTVIAPNKVDPAASSAEPASPVSDIHLANPDAKAEDVGLAPPGSGIEMDDINGSDD